MPWRRNHRLMWLIFLCLSKTFYHTLGITFLIHCKKVSRAQVTQAIKRWANSLLKTIKLTVCCTNFDKLQYQPHRRYIIMSNHASHFDIPIIYGSLPGDIRMISKQEISKIPLFGPLVTKTECVYIDRKNKANALQALQQAQQILESGIILWVAPEGTRSKDGKLLPFKKGVFHLALDAEATIIPVAICGANHVMPAKKLQIKANSHVEVKVGDFIDSRDFTKAELNKLIDTTYASIEELLRMDSRFRGNDTGENGNDMGYASIKGK